MTKQEARKIMKRRRKELAGDERARCEEKAREHFLQWLEKQGTGWVYPFVSCGTEIDTICLIRNLLEQRQALWRVAVPKVTGDRMVFVEITELGNLKPGAMGILEPEKGRIVEAGSGVMLLPGLAFDVTGNRVGYGAGFYDRYLEQYDGEQLIKAGYAFSFQLVDHIEAEEHDRMVDYVITDAGNIKTGMPE